MYILNVGEKFNNFSKLFDSRNFTGAAKNMGGSSVSNNLFCLWDDVEFSMPRFYTVQYHTENPCH